MQVTGATPRGTLAVFDLDGTITRHDTLIQYVMLSLKTRPWRVFGFLLVLPALIGHFIGVVDRGGLKASVIRATLGGSTRQQIEAMTREFVPRVLSNGVFKAALERIAQHRKNGDYLVLMSASVDLYVPVIARELGFDDVTCTGVRWDGDRLNGSLTTPNCRDEEKVIRLQALQAQHPGMQSIAYGNAGSDLPHMRHVSKGVLVNGSATARQQAAAMGNVVCENWS